MQINVDSAQNQTFRFTCIHLRSGMVSTCCTCVVKLPFKACLHWAPVKGEGTYGWWLRLNGQLPPRWVAVEGVCPPTSCFLCIAMATWCICMPQTLVLLLTWLQHSDSWMHIRVCTHTLDPKAATVGDYQQRKWVLKCLSPTHTALEQKKMCG